MYIRIAAIYNINQYYTIVLLCYVYSFMIFIKLYVRSNIWVEDQRSGSLDQGHGDSSPLDPVARVNIGTAKLMVDTYLWGWSKTHIHNPNYIVHKVGVKSFGVHPNSEFLFGSDNWYFDSRATYVTWFFSSLFFDDDDGKQGLLLWPATVPTNQVWDAEDGCLSRPLPPSIGASVEAPIASNRSLGMETYWKLFKRTSVFFLVFTCIYSVPF